MEFPLEKCSYMPKKRDNMQPPSKESPSQTKHNQNLLLRYGGSAAVPPSQFSLHAERIERDQAGPSGIKREPKWGYPHSGSTLLARIPRALPAPAAPLPEFWGAPRIPASTKTTPGNSGKQRRRVLRISRLGRCFLKRTAAG